jgi:acyl carrier protein
VFIEALDLEPETDVEALRHRDHVKWDSLGHLGLVAAIEEQFDVELDADQLLDLDTFDAAVRILGELGADG